MKTSLLIACLGALPLLFARAGDLIFPPDIQALFEKDAIHNAVLLNNSDGREIDPKTGKLKGDLGRLGTPVNPKDVMIIAEAFVPDRMVKLYTSIKRLPDWMVVVRILYTVSDDGKTATLIGYTVEKPRKKDVAFVRYDDSLPWFEWITKSLAALPPRTEPGAVPSR